MFVSNELILYISWFNFLLLIRKMSEGMKRKMCSDYTKKNKKKKKNVKYYFNFYCVLFQKFDKKNLFHPKYPCTQRE